MKCQKTYFVRAVLLAVLALVGVGATTAFTGQHEAVMQRVKITATNYAFDAPAQIKAGLVSVTLENKGDEPHHAAFVRLKDGVTMEQLKEALAQNQDSAFGLITFAGGPGTVDPHGRQEVIMRLTPGDYVIVCFVPDDEDGTPHFARGMVRPITVTANPGQDEVQEPKADGTVKLKDFAFDLPAEINPGHHVWLVENEGPQPHELNLVKLAAGKSIDDLKAFFQSNNPGRPPFEDVGGFEPIQAGDQGWMMLNLTPGTYVALCFVPDPETGKAHADLGMIQSFDVVKPVAAAASQPATSEEVIGQAGEDWIVAENGTYIPAIDQLGYHLDLAHRHFVGKAFKDAAGEIRAGATFLKEAAAKLEEKTTKTALDAAAGDLMTLADRVEQGQLTSVTDLNAAFEKAFQVDVENRWIGLKAKEVAPIADRISTHFEEAVQALKDKDYQAASVQLRQAAALLKLEEARAAEAAREPVTISIKDLNRLADNLMQGSQDITIQDLNHVFARAHGALTHYHGLRAAAAKARGQMEEVGQELNAAASELEHALNRANAGPRNDSAPLVSELRRLGDELIAGKTPEARQVGKILEDIGQQLKALGAEVETTIHAAPDK